ncbi:hypothetical protein D3C86_1074200 [compost metagenome]
MVAQEGRPLAVGRDIGSLAEDPLQGLAALLLEGQVHARHDREVEGDVQLVPVAEVGTHVLGPLVGLAEHDGLGVVRVHVGAQLLEVKVGPRQVLAVGALFLEEVGDGVRPETIEPHVHPELEDVEHLLADLGVLVIEIRLVAEEAVPVVLLGGFVPGPVGCLGVGEDDAGAGVLAVVVAPDVVVVVRVVGALAGLLKPGVVARRVVEHQVRDDSQVAFLGLLHEALEVVEGPQVRVDVLVVRDVVAVVPQRRGIHGQDPDAVDPQVLDVVEPARQPDEVAQPVPVAVLEGSDRDLVEDGVLVPVRRIRHPCALL